MIYLFCKFATFWQFDYYKDFKKSYGSWFAKVYACVFVGREYKYIKAQIHKIALSTDESCNRLVFNEKRTGLTYIRFYYFDFIF